MWTNTNISLATANGKNKQNRKEKKDRTCQKKTQDNKQNVEKNGRYSEKKKGQ
jgi:hypothetical protein